MCGIAGLFLPHGRLAREPLERMAAALRHRGPDDMGIYLRQPLGLAHTRLSIIDLSGGQQPLRTQQDGHVAVVNGEIYNYLELRKALQQRGAEFATHSDSEVLLRGFELDGLDVLPTLRGMYAFALYQRASGDLYLGRDRLGIKPLYYAEVPGGVAFASELRALTPLVGDTSLRPEAVVAYLQHQFSSGRHTAIKGIQRVLPGEVIRIDAEGRLHHQQYWRLNQLQPRRIGFEQAKAEFDQLMDEVMREHMRSDVPYGLFLSGGVDSAILCAELQKRQSQPIRSYSIGFHHAKTACEISDAERIAQRFGCEHTSFRIHPDQLYRRLPHMIGATDELMRDAACLGTSLLAERAAQDLKVVFTGEGGDEVFAGYGRYRRSAVQSLLKGVLKPGSGGFRTRGHWKSARIQALWHTPLRRVCQHHHQAFVDAWAQTPRHWSALQRRQFTDLTTALPDNLLLKADRMLMSFGLEGRVPFLDHRVVEFGLSLPDELKIQRRQGKWFLKRWAETQLPKDHLYAKKRGFGVPWGQWLRGRQRQQVAQKLAHNPIIREWFCEREIQRLGRDADSKEQGVSELLSLIQFALWHRFVVEQPDQPPSSDEALLDCL